LYVFDEFDAATLVTLEQESRNLAFVLGSKREIESDGQWLVVDVAHASFEQAVPVEATRDGANFIARDRTALVNVETADGEQHWTFA
jgi:hypothetical protein